MSHSGLGNSFLNADEVEDSLAVTPQTASTEIRLEETSSHSPKPPSKPSPRGPPNKQGLLGRPLENQELGDELSNRNKRTRRGSQEALLRKAEETSSNQLAANKSTSDPKARVDASSATAGERSGTSGRQTGSSKSRTDATTGTRTGASVGGLNGPKTIAGNATTTTTTTTTTTGARKSNFGEILNGRDQHQPDTSVKTSEGRIQRIGTTDDYLSMSDEEELGKKPEKVGGTGGDDREASGATNDDPGLKKKAPVTADDVSIGSMGVSILANGTYLFGCFFISRFRIYYYPPVGEAHGPRARAVNSVDCLHLYVGPPANLGSGKVARRCCLAATTVVRGGNVFFFLFRHQRRPRSTPGESSPTSVTAVGNS